VSRILSEDKITSNTLIGNINDTSNYVTSASNILVNFIKSSSFDTSSQWSTSNNNIYYNTSNVGIGTAIPNNKLHIYDNNIDTTSLIIQNNTSINTLTITTVPNVLPINIDGTDYIYQMFTYTGTPETNDNTSYTFNTNKDLICDILIVGGGGSGGQLRGGGGGAGGLVYVVNTLLSTGTYTINVGRGGIGTLGTTINTPPTVKQNGVESSIKNSDGSTYISKTLDDVSQQLRGYGGGRGGTMFYNGSSYTYTYTTGVNGGSGGGGTTGVASSTVTAAGTATQGNTYWDGTSYVAGGDAGRPNLITVAADRIYYNSGGGGGAGTNAINAVDGNNGVEINITGQSKFYAAGGGAAVQNIYDGIIYDISNIPVGNGGSGVGGNGQVVNSTTTNTFLRSTATSGTPNTGSGGGGGGAGDLYTPSGTSGNGGTGVVIIRYTTNLTSSSIEFRRTTTNTVTNYNVGNYNGYLKIVSKSLSSSNELLSMTSLGNIGIGTQGTTTYKLNVNGNINANSISTTSINATSINTNSISANTSILGPFINVTSQYIGAKSTIPNIFPLEVIKIGNTITGTTVSPNSSNLTIAPKSVYFNTLSTTALANASNGIFPNICAKFTGSIWGTSFILISSDSRIKEDIQDINDDSALQMILAIEPKTYKYIDKIERGGGITYGFIAQQIREVIPEAVSIQTSYIPNIMLLADYNDNIITLPLLPNYIIKQNDTIKCYDKNNTCIIVECNEVIDELKFKIKNIDYKDNKIFVYGTEVDNFHTLNKSYIFTLNVCATQELYRIIKLQEERIKELEKNMAILLNK
jgi:hypothetical protein